MATRYAAAAVQFADNYWGRRLGDIVLNGEFVDCANLLGIQFFKTRIT
jgi:hypothetical protein